LLSRFVKSRVVLDLVDVYINDDVSTPFARVDDFKRICKALLDDEYVSMIPPELKDKIDKFTISILDIDDIFADDPALDTV